MATLKSTQLTNDAASPPVRGEFNRNGSAVRFKLGTYVLTGSELTGDVVQMVSLPKGAIVDIYLSYIKWEDLGGTVTVEVGDGDDPDRYCSALAMGTASTTLTTTFEESVAVGTYKAEHEYTANDTIDLTLTTVTTGGTALSVKMFVFYTMNG